MTTPKTRLEEAQKQIGIVADEHLDGEAQEDARRLISLIGDLKTTLPDEDDN